MSVAAQFIKNLKVMSDKKIFTHDEIKLILLTFQEAATLSPLEVISILDNFEVLTDESNAEMTQDEFDSLKSELIDV